MSTGFLLSDDLMFTSRIVGTAKSHQLEMSSFKSAAKLLEQAQSLQPACVIMDLHLEGLDVPAFVASLKSLEPAPVLVAYGSHVEAETLRAAREAGCDLVLPRSKFVQDLPEALPGWMAGKLA